VLFKVKSFQSYQPMAAKRPTGSDPVPGKRQRKAPSSMSDYHVEPVIVVSKPIKKPDGTIVGAAPPQLPPPAPAPVYVAPRPHVVVAPAPPQPPPIIEPEEYIYDEPPAVYAAPPKKALARRIANESHGVEVYIVSELLGEGRLHACSTREKATDIEEGLIFDGVNAEQSGPNARHPFKVAGAAVGQPLWVTVLYDGGCCYYVGGVFTSKVQARAHTSSHNIPFRYRGEGGTMDVIELYLE